MSSRLSTTPLHEAKCVLCDALLDDCVCMLDVARPSIFGSPILAAACEQGRELVRFDSSIDLSGCELEEE